MRFGLILDKVFANHETPAGHPERPDRVNTLIRAFEAWQDPRLRRIPPIAAEDDWILGVHSVEHLERIRSTAGQRLASLDSDTQTSAESFEVALLAAGSAVKLVESLYQEKIDGGMLLARPPGHHAESNRAMGFCLFNNVAVAAEWAIRAGLSRKVAIVDFDVHHGNGIQEIFYSRPDVLYLSSHQYPFYPGTGSMDEIGIGPGRGFTVNFPFRGGSGDAFYAGVYEKIAVPVLREFAPDLILISAGYDAHLDDPLGGMKLSVSGYGYLSSILLSVAREVCEGRILFFLEGGYDLKALSDSVVCSVKTMLEGSKHSVGAGEESALAEYRERVADVLSEHWQCLRGGFSHST
jgi:acetoin utilization deacetylase AcuC-like enzyme